QQATKRQMLDGKVRSRSSAFTTPLPYTPVQNRSAGSEPPRGRGKSMLPSEPISPNDTTVPRPAPHGLRPSIRGKFLCVGDEKLWVRGVTYGAFRPDTDGTEYHDLKAIDRDFGQMAANGINAVRIPHTMPPRALLDAAQRHGLWVMVGLSAEQYVGYLID